LAVEVEKLVAFINRVEMVIRLWETDYSTKQSTVISRTEISYFIDWRNMVCSHQ